MTELKCLYNLCADKPIYEMSNYTLFGCKISPNTITSINLFLITPLIFYNFIFNGSYIMLLVFALLRIYLDILDGHIARKCKMQSRFGAFYDYLGDFILTNGLSIILLYNIFLYGNNNYILSFVITFLVLYNIFRTILLIKKKIKILQENDINENNLDSEISTLLGDNSIVCILFPIFAVKFFINYLK
jgi:phosphatidylglycerophosphate synthase